MKQEPFWLVWTQSVTFLSSSFLSSELLTSEFYCSPLEIGLLMEVFTQYFPVATHCYAM